jgi:hypothetical protein
MSSPEPSFRLGRPLLAVTACLLGLTAVLAAQRLGSLAGKVIDDETGEGVPFAVIKIRGREPITADSTGRFRIPNLPAGNLQLAVQAIGYSASDFRLSLLEGQNLDRSFALEFNGTRLPDLEVKARAQRLTPRYSEFERRRGLGMGTYWRWDEIKERNFGSVGDLLRNVRGVRIRCDQAKFECFAVMSRTPQCQPTWWIDGVEVRSFHENTPIRDVYGMEIYRGPGEVPGDFGGSNAACGAIVMWTKSRPYR